MYRKLEALLVEIALTKHELAAILDISYNTLLLKMNGKSYFTLNEALEVKRALGVSLTLEELFAQETVKQQHEKEHHQDTA